MHDCMTVRQVTGFRLQASAIRDSSSSGAALMTALGLLFIFCMMGMAYVDYMSITIDSTHYDQRLLRVRTLASSGVEAGVGEIQQALVSGRVAELLATPREIQFPVYESNRQDAKGFAPQTNRLAAAKVTVTEEKGPLAALAAKGATTPVRCYRIVSESRISNLGPKNIEMQTTHGHAEAVVVFGERNIRRTLYWNERL